MSEHLRLTVARLRTALAVTGVEFADEGLELMLRIVGRQRRAAEAIRARPTPNDLAPSFIFSSVMPGIEVRARPVPDGPPMSGEIAELGRRLRAGETTCTALAEEAMARLRAADPTLHCVVTMTEERALAQAAVLDREAEAGQWRGPLHGIPWGAKDLLAVAGYPTTWGAAPYREQVIEADATVVRRLDGAGGVLVAKLTSGELAVNDTWFGGQTRNPWEPDKGSSGSSAGPASAVAAGLLPFAIGTETLGSIVSPSVVCGCSSLRPTFGRVSRHGAMALVWTMDKLGPMCRTVADAAVVFDAIVGPDGLDPTVLDQPWSIPAAVDVRGWRVGFDEAAFDAEPEETSQRHVLDELGALGVELVPFTLPSEPSARTLSLILTAESGAAFDELTRSDGIDLLANQTESGWPTSFRSARLISAVDYINATRQRTALMHDVHAAIAGLDAWVHPSWGGPHLGITNYTGHPAVTCPTAGIPPRNITFSGQLFDEARVLALAHAWQSSTTYHHRHPPNFWA